MNWSYTGFIKQHCVSGQVDSFAMKLISY